MTNKELINLVETEFSPEKINTKIFGNDIGCNQFRELATLCKKAECCDEIEILIKYDTAKDNSCKTWGAYHNGVTFGDAVLDCIKRVKETDTEQDERAILNDLSIFFGYLYRYARIQKSNADKEHQFDKNSDNKKQSNR